MSTPNPVPNKWLDEFRKKAAAQSAPTYEEAPTPLQVVRILSQPNPPIGHFKSDKVSLSILHPKDPTQPDRDTQTTLVPVVLTLSKVLSKWGEYVTKQADITDLLAEHQELIRTKLGFDIYKLMRAISSQSFAPLFEIISPKTDPSGRLWSWPSEKSRFVPRLGIISRDVEEKLTLLFKDFSSSAKAWVPEPGTIPLLCYTYVEVKRLEPQDPEEIQDKLYRDPTLGSLIPGLRDAVRGISIASFPREINLYHYFYSPMVVIRPSGDEGWRPRPLGPGCFRLHTRLDIQGYMHQRGLLAGYPVHEGGFFHPHAEIGGGCCLGHYTAEALGGLSTHHDLGVILDLFSGYLTHANHSGAYGGQSPLELCYNLTSAEMAQLSAICGDDLPLKWKSLLSAPSYSEDRDEDEDGENDEAYQCSVCGHPYDNEDLYTCNNCGERVCPRCSHDVYGYRPGRGTVERGRWCTSCIDNSCSLCEECGEYYVDSATLECTECETRFCLGCDSSDHILHQCSSPECSRTGCTSCVESNHWVQSKDDPDKWYCPDHAPAPEDTETPVKESLPMAPTFSCYVCGRVGCWVPSPTSGRIICPDCIPAS